MYVERGMEEIVRLKMEMGLCEEEEREFDEFALLWGESFFFSSGFGFGENEIFGFSLFLCFELCFLRAEIFGCFFFPLVRLLLLFLFFVN